GITRPLIEACGVQPGAVVTAVADAVAKLPSTSGASVSSPAASGALNRVLVSAADVAAELKDDYVSTEHLLLALAAVESTAKSVLASAGVTEQGLRGAFASVRGNTRVTTPDPESTYQALEK